MTSQFRVGQQVIMNSTFSRGSRYIRYAGKVGKIVYNNNGNTFDLEFKDVGSNNQLNYVSPKMFRSTNELKSPEQKREALKQSLIARRRDAEKVLEQKKAFIDDIMDRVAYLHSNPDVTEIDEAAYTAWSIATSLHNYLQNKKIAEASGARTLTDEEVIQGFAYIVLNVLKTTNK